MTEKITFESHRVGVIEVAPDNIVHFEPIPGFPGRTRYVVMEHAQSAEFAWLVSLEDPDLAFVVASPWAFFPDYDPPVEREHLGSLGIDKKEQVELLSMVSLDGAEIYLNLAAPLLINVSNRRGLQVVTDDPRYATRVALPTLKADRREDGAVNPDEASLASEAFSPAPTR